MFAIETCQAATRMALKCQKDEGIELLSRVEELSKNLEGMRQRIVKQLDTARHYTNPDDVLPF